MCVCQSLVAQCELAISCMKEDDLFLIFILNALQIKVGVGLQSKNIDSQGVTMLDC